MVKRLAVIWVAGLLTVVPLATYHLLFRAPRDQYALLITGILFWIFGYWAVATPLVSAWRVRRLWKSLERIRSPEELQRLLAGKPTRDAVIDLLASENHIPRFLAARVYRLVESRLQRPAGKP